jgi:WD40 repeat protein
MVSSGEVPSIQTLRDSDNVFGVMDFQPRGDTLATAGADGAIKFWDVARADAKGVLRAHDGEIKGLAYGAKGKMLISVDDEGWIRVWDTQRTQGPRPIAQGPVAFALNPLLPRIATGHLQVIDIRTGKIVSQLGEENGHLSPIWRMVYSPDGRRLATVSEFEPFFSNSVSEVKVWDLETGKTIHSLPGVRIAIRALGFHPNGRELAIGRDDNFIEIWDTEDWKLRQSFHVSLISAQFQWVSVLDLAYHPNGKRLAWSTGRAELVVENLDQGNVVWSKARMGFEVRDLAYSSDGTSIAGGCTDGRLRLWEGDRGQLLWTSQRLRGEIQAVAFHPDGSRLASGTDNGVIKLWAADEGQEVFTLHNARLPVEQLDFSKDGRTLFGVLGGEILAWEISDRIRPTGRKENGDREE